MNVPRWVAAIIGGLVTIFGIYRIYISRRSNAQDEAARKQGGLYAMKRSTHLLIGLLYVGMGVLILLKVFGVDLFPKFGN